MTRIATSAESAAKIPAPVQGLERGTKVYTLKGAVPVERLRAGDRIVTRSGAAVLRGLVRSAGDAFALDFDRPQIVLLADRQVHSDTCATYAA